MNLAEATLDEIAATASRLLGWHVATVIPVRRGGNNRVFQISGDESHAVLKVYPSQKEDPRDRLGHEYAALSFLARYGVTQVPRPIACDRDLQCAAYEWVEGVPPRDPDFADIDEMADFFLRLQELRGCEGAEALPEGATPALSLASVALQLQQRFDRLMAAVPSGSEAAEFVASELRPVVATAIAHLRDGYARSGVGFDVPLPPPLRVLSPSDFGFHNALRQPSGRLAFLDFEYFGWDEPVKAVADVMLHAGMALPDELARRYRQRVSEALTRNDPGFPARFELLFPALRATWCLILLNEFLPERWARRVLSGAAYDREAAQIRQLAKARDMITRSCN